MIEKYKHSEKVMNVAIVGFILVGILASVDDPIIKPGAFVIMWIMVTFAAHGSGYNGAFGMSVFCGGILAGHADYNWTALGIWIIGGFACVVFGLIKDDQEKAAYKRRLEELD